ncbi:MAG: hypothetical protein WAT92_21350 [Saprospiraceae bacterium]
MKKFTSSSTINLAASQINLYEWLISMSENDYKNCSKSHKALGLVTIDNVEGMINVENLGGQLLIQHYKMIDKHPQHLVLESLKSDVYLFHLLKVHVQVEWRMSLKPLTNNSCEFTCQVGVKYPNQFLKMAHMIVGGNYFLAKHTNEEGPLFANYIEKKFTS